MAYIPTSPLVSARSLFQTVDDEAEPMAAYHSGDHWLRSMQTVVILDPTDKVVDVAFDPLEDIIWSITRKGHISSLHSSSLFKYVSNTVPMGRMSTGKTIIPCAGGLKRIYPSPRTAEHAIYVLASNALYAYNKFGWHMSCKSNDHMRDLECFVVTGQTGASPNCTSGATNATQGFSRMYAGGLQSNLLELDAQERWGELSRTLDVGSGGAVILRTFANGLCAANTKGQVLVIDPRREKSVVRELNAHTGEISDLALVPFGYTVVTSGWNQFGGMAGMEVDLMLKVFDIRTGGALAPLPTQLDPSFVRFYPGSADRVLTASQLGGFQTIQFDKRTRIQSELGRLWPTNDRIAALDISQNGNFLVFCTGTGQIQLYSNNIDKFEFNDETYPTEHASRLADSLLLTNRTNTACLSDPWSPRSNTPHTKVVGANLLQLSCSAAKSIEVQMTSQSIHREEEACANPERSLFARRVFAATDTVLGAYKPIDFDDEDFFATNVLYLASPPPPKPTWEVDSSDSDPEEIRRKRRMRKKISSADWPEDMCKLPGRTMLRVDPELIKKANSNGVVKKPFHWGSVWHPYPFDLDDPTDPLNCDMTFGRFVSVKSRGRRENPVF